MKKYFILFAILIPVFLKAQINLTSGLIAYFQMNGNGNDTSIVNIDGTFVGAVPTIGINGGPSTALHFNAANQDKLTAGTSNRGLKNTVSISCWFKTSNTSLQHLVEKYDWNTDKGFVLDIYNQKICLAGRNGTTNYYEFYGTTIVTDGLWHHVVGIMDDNIWTIYVDCAFQSTKTTTSGNIANGTAPLAIGYYYVGSNLYFDGDMDEVRLYDRVLNTAEINYLCDVVSNSVKENSVSDINNIVISPNPVTDQFTIGNVKPTSNLSLKVCDSFGKLVLHTPYINSQVSIEKFAAGFYIVELSDTKGILVGRSKFLKN
jgi:hypothetical protein